MSRVLNTLSLLAVLATVTPSLAQSTKSDDRPKTRPPKAVTDDRPTTVGQSDAGADKRLTIETADVTIEVPQGAETDDSPRPATQRRAKKTFRSDSIAPPEETSRRGTSVDRPQAQATRPEQIPDTISGQPRPKAKAPRGSSTTRRSSTQHRTSRTEDILEPKKKETPSRPQRNAGTFLRSILGREDTPTDIPSIAGPPQTSRVIRLPFKSPQELDVAHMAAIP